MEVSHLSGFVGALALLALLTIACGGATEWPLSSDLAQREDRIIDGEPATADDYPSVGALIFLGDDFGTTVAGLHCTGTLIAPDVVLLAAHCLEVLPIPAPTFYFTFDLDVSDFGNSTFDLPVDAVEVADTIGHGQFDLSALVTPGSPGVGEFFDIGLAFLRTAITSVDPATVMRKEDADEIKSGAAVVITGYGRRTADPSVTDNGIKYIASSVINEISTAEMQIGNVPPTPQKCHGDSGGPTFMGFRDGFLPRERVIGITSHTYDDTNCAKGGVDTRVDPYWDWIDQNMILACAGGTRVASVCATNKELVRPVVQTLPTIPSKPGDNPGNNGCTQSAPPSGWLVFTALLGFRRRRSPRPAE